MWPPINCTRTFGELVRMLCHFTIDFSIIDTVPQQGVISCSRDANRKNAWCCSHKSIFRPEVRPLLALFFELGLSTVAGKHNS